MIFKNKHVFIFGNNDKFFYLQADALITKANIEPSELCAIVLNYSSKHSFEGLKKVAGVTYFKYSDKILESIAESKSITTISLNSKNSNVIRQIIDFDCRLINRLYLFITDDEVDRWSSLFHEKGRFVVDNKKLIDHDVIEVLSKIKNVIASKATFEPLITSMLNRKINFIDCGIIFDTLPVELNSKLTSLFSDVKPTEDLKLLYGTKGMPIGALSGLFSLCSNLVLDKSQLSFVLLSQNPLKVLLIELIRVYFYFIKNKRINFDYINPTDPLTYTCIVMSCSHIILQGRGGASTAKAFAKLARGVICIENDTHNSHFFENSYNQQILKYNSIEGLAKKIVTSNVDKNENKLQLEMLEKNWVARFTDLYK